MFAPDEMIYYGMQGVCRITEIRKESLHGTVQEYYVLKPLDLTCSSILVPIQNERLVNRIRPIVTPKEIEQILSSLSQEESLWENDETKRKKQFQALLNEGNPLQLLRIIQTLYLHRQQLQVQGRRRLHLCDETVLKRAKHLIAEEFSASLQLSQEEIFPYIQKTLETAQTT
mgnify:CR=1 FL=1